MHQNFVFLKSWRKAPAVGVDEDIAHLMSQGKDGPPAPGIVYDEALSAGHFHYEYGKTIQA